MHLAFNNNPSLQYSLDGILVEDVKSEKDLGLLVSENLSWDDNIRTCIKDANQCIGWISRNLLTRDYNIISKVYKTIIRPKLEYCVQLQNPAMAIGQLFQNQSPFSIYIFTRIANNVGLLPYSKWLKLMNLTTLGERRIRGDLIETYKIVTGKVKYGKIFLK